MLVLFDWFQDSSRCQSLTLLDEELCPDVGANVLVQRHLDLLAPGVSHHYQNASTQGRLIHRNEDPKENKDSG